MLVSLHNLQNFASHVAHYAPELLLINPSLQISHILLSLYWHNKQFWTEHVRHWPFFKTFLGLHTQEDNYVGGQFGWHIPSSFKVYPVSQKSHLSMLSKAHKMQLSTSQGLQKPPSLTKVGGQMHVPRG